MKRILSFLFLLCLFCSCSRDKGKILLQHPRQDTRVVVSFSVYTSETEAITRAVDENTIADLNLYLVDNLTLECLHFYTQTPYVQFSCHAGKYKLFIVANAHKDIGNMTYEQIEDFNADYDSTSDKLMMTAQKVLTLKSSENPVELPAIEVKRFAAKINYSIATDLPDLEIRSVQVMHLPQRATPFVSGNPSAFIDGPIWENAGAANAFSGSFYMLPNCQGTVTGIVGQEQKNPENAPEDATYLRIRATRGTKILDYLVYLGENNTDNFDVRTNTSHTLNIVIRGDNETDVRVRSYTVAIQSRIDVVPQNGIFLSIGRITLSIALSGKYTDMDLRAELEVKTGNLRYFNFLGRRNQAVFSIPALTESETYLIRYEPETFTRENMLLNYTVSFYDRYGRVADFDFSFTFAHAVKVYTKWYGGIYGDGTVSAPDAIHSTETVSPSSFYYTFYCPAEGCTLIASPSPNGKFGGWYTGPNDTGFLSLNPAYKYVPEQSEATLYASFN